MGTLSLAAYGQLGVAPSQTGAFLEELRERHGYEQKDVLGEDRAALEAGRPTIRPYLLRPFSSDAMRLDEDNPFGTGHYQVGREYLNPWNEGLSAPVRTPCGIEGLEAGFVFEPMGTLSRFSDQYRGSAVAWLDVSARYAVTPGQWLTLDASFGLNDYSYLALLPGSTLAYDLIFGPVAITVYDRVTTRWAKFDESWGNWQNDVGAAVTWQVNPDWALTLNYNEASRETRDRVTRSLNGVAHFTASEVWRGGIEAGYAWTEYESPAFNQGHQRRIGAFAERAFPAQAALLKVSVGFQNFEFERGTLIFVGFPPFAYFSTGEPPDLSAPYFNAIFSQKLGPSISHELEVGYESTLNSTVNYITAAYANYGLTAGFWRGTRLTVSGFVENVDRSGGVFVRDAYETGGDLYLTQTLCAKLTAGFNFHYAVGGTGRIPRGDSTINYDDPIYGVTFDYALGEGRSFKMGCTFIGCDPLALTAGLRIPF
ncbi:MAG: hypothetical protein U0984_08525 [Prosthecobacter sp.]|nr:hypothetical protein [Prosthecobacter sp.]